MNSLDNPQIARDHVTSAPSLPGGGPVAVTPSLPGGGPVAVTPSLPGGGDGLKKQSKYIDFKINGRLFPTWVLANFSEYKLPEILKTDEDKCAGMGDTKKKLREVQLFISKFLDYNSPYHDILIYHGLGAGKTATAINVY